MIEFGLVVDPSMPKTIKSEAFCKRLRGKILCQIGSARTWWREDLSHQFGLYDVRNKITQSTYDSWDVLS